MSVARLVLSEITASPVWERAGAQLCQPRLRSASVLALVVFLPRNERASSCTKLLRWRKYREVFHMAACSAKSLNVPMWGNSCHLDPSYVFVSYLIIAD